MKSFLRSLFLVFLLPMLSLAQGVPPSGGGAVWTALSDPAIPASDNAIDLGTAAKRWRGIYVGTVNTGAFTAPAATGIVMTSAVADSGSNIAFILNNSTTLSGTTALLSIRNNGTEHLWLSRAGVLRIQQTTGGLAAPYLGDGSAVARITMNTFQSNDGTDYRGRAADGATAVSHKFGGTVALTTAGAKIAGFYNDANVLTTLKAAIDKDGNVTPGSDGGASLGTAALRWADIRGVNLFGNNYLDLDGNTHMVVGASVGSSYTGRIADGASAVAHKFKNSISLTNAAANISEWYSDDGTTLKLSLSAAGKHTYNSTDSSGTPGAVQIDKPSGRVAIAATASSVVVTNSTVTAASHPVVTITESDTTCTSLLRAVPAAGTLTITLNATCTSDTNVDFVIFN